MYIRLTYKVMFQAALHDLKIIVKIHDINFFNLLLRTMYLKSVVNGAPSLNPAISTDI